IPPLRRTIRADAFGPLPPAGQKVFDANTARIAPGPSSAPAQGFYRVAARREPSQRTKRGYTSDFASSPLNAHIPDASRIFDARSAALPAMGGRPIRSDRSRSRGIH